MPGFRKTPEEVGRIEKFLRPARFKEDAAAIDFKTTWEFARWVLPPCFEPIGDKAKNTADGFVYIASCESAYGGEQEFGSISLRVFYGKTEGDWMITQIITGDFFVAIGRELWGEVKKHGNARVCHDGTHHYAYLERFGLRVVEIEMEITGPELGPSVDLEQTAFDIKMFPHADPRKGLQWPPLLNIWDVRFEHNSLREGTGTLRFGHSKWDPTDTIPIVEVGKARWDQSCSYYQLGEQIQLEDPDDVYKQILWGRNYDDPTFFRIPTRWQGLDELNPDPDLELYPNLRSWPNLG